MSRKRFSPRPRPIYHTKVIWVSNTKIEEEYDNKTYVFLCGLSSTPNIVYVKIMMFFQENEESKQRIMVRRFYVFCNLQTRFTYFLKYCRLGNT